MPRIEEFKEDNLIWNTAAFPNKLNVDEDIVLVIREDILIIAFKAIGFVILFLIFLVVKILLAAVPNIAVVALFDSIFYTASSLIILVFAYNFHNYYLSLQIVTDKRLIDIDQTGLFRREVNELSLDRIEDVSYRQNGIWGAIFNFGTVSVQTAAEVATESNQSKALTGGFVFQNVPAPAEVHAIISDLYHKQKSKDAHYNAQLQAQYLADIVNK
jgi:uncharacterized membrane protein YdbT with pleckstrin-like domain